ncbi:MAG: cytochrome c oxidase accessory protein CcoG [Gammaproteobacteria bacterium]|nr:cytochrome c oxidase accessory protein CcoG [Gammaproteobacteria bacterium]
MNSPIPPFQARHGTAADAALSAALYAKHNKIYTREVHGLFASARVITAVTLLGIFYTTPWLQWQGRQAVLLDLPARKFYILGLTFWPQDFLFLTFFLMLAALSLFFFTALAGRLWCGYACPQTVWTESFLWIERVIEGSRQQQLKLDRAPWSWRKIRLKSLKHAVWLLFSALTGFTFVAYFTPARTMAQNLTTLGVSPWEWFWMGFYGIATYGNAGWLREQVCKYMCPYARFQGAMFDRDTLIISYDARRGEPRGSRSSSANPRALALGDCINCTLCVQVCPTGIDIRNGLQYECIGCSACIDVCDEVMDKMAYPRGLIRYTTERALNGGALRVLRPRIVLYGLILTALTGLFGYRLTQRVPVGLDVLHDRNQLYRETADAIENVYTLKVLNKRDARRHFQLRAEGPAGLELLVDVPDIVVGAGDVLEVPVRLRAPESALTAQSVAVRFVLTAREDPNTFVTTEAKFIGPIP